MGQVVYADLLFLVNFSMDFLCFFVTARLLHRRFKVARSILAAAMGGVYSVAILFVSMNAILGLIADLGFCMLMCLCAYGIKDKTFGDFMLHTTVYFGVSMGTGGCMTAMYSLLNRMDLPLGEVEKNPDGISVWLFGLLAIISGCTALWGGKLFRSSADGDVYEIVIAYGGSSLTISGMVDTGNLLKDPISGKPIIIVEKKALLGIIDEGVLNKSLRGDAEGIVSQSSSHRVRIVPMNTASGRSVVCAFVPEKLIIRSKKHRKSKEADALFAPAELKFSSEKAAVGCSALIPLDIV